MKNIVYQKYTRGEGIVDSAEEASFGMFSNSVYALRAINYSFRKLKCSISLLARVGGVT